MAWTLEDLELPDASPWWMRQRLAQCGVRAISPLVDVTNLVMLELGQPMHAYDLATLAGPELRVRWAREGETLTTLDDVERDLHPDDLVVTDADRPVGLGGVMGGAATEVSDDTTSVVFEAATWDPATIRRTSRRLRLTSEASTRFERGVDPAGAERACARAAQLVQDMGRASDRGVTRDGSAEVARPTVTVSSTWIRSFLGLGDEPDAGRQAQLLRDLGCTVEQSGDQLDVTPPSWRTDVARPADVAEEVARLHGYDRIPATLPLTGVTGGLTAAQRAERDVRDAIRAFGLHEVVTRPFVGADHLDGVHPGGDPVVLSNPLAKDASAMRTSLVEGLLQVVRHNVGQGRPGWRCSRSVGSSALPAARSTSSSTRSGTSGAGRPRQDGCCRPSRAPWRWPCRDAVPGPGSSTVTDLGRGRGAGGPRRGRPPPRAHPGRLDSCERRAVTRDGLHPYRTAVLELVGLGADPTTPHELGIVGQLHPTEAERRDLPEPVVVAELLLEPMLLDVAAGREPVPGPRLVRHPAMTVDVAVVADDEVPWARLDAAIRAAAGDLLDELAVFDEYRGEQIGEGRRSVAARLRLQAPDRALTSEDEEAVLAAVRREVEAVGAQLRG